VTMFKYYCFMEVPVEVHCASVLVKNSCECSSVVLLVSI
jgi:hypothetical protein